MLASFDQRSFRFHFRNRFVGSKIRREPARWLLALAIVIGLFGDALAPAPPAALAARLSAAADVALMAGPGATFGVLTTVPAGSSLKVEGDASDGFVPVSYNGVSGWVPAGAVDNGDSGGDNGANGGNDGGGKGNGGNASAAPADTATNASSTSSDTAPAGDASGAAPAAAPATDSGLNPPAGGQYSQNQVIGIITDAAHQYGQNSDDMVRVARCESGLNPSAVGGGQYYGLFQ
ncbi:MAG TPA: SH3 domain-containing protein, partial [Thermomicrobiales bacterium]|nr:SH3 domain-containing protein [Thermomicrobiales bacterium]